LAPVLRFTRGRNLEAQERVVRIFREVMGYQEMEAGDCVERFVKRMGLPTRLSEVGVTDDKQVEEIAERTMTDVWVGGKRQMEFDEIMEILNAVR
jgi:alcohol dehydrogenase class IV